MYFVYILQSLKDKSYYTGHAKNLNIRLKRHNDGRVKSTKSKRPWKIIYEQRFDTKQEAYRGERLIKSYKGGQAFEKLIK